MQQQQSDYYFTTATSSERFTSDNLIQTGHKRLVYVTVEEKEKVGNVSIIISCEREMGKHDEPELHEKEREVTIDIHIGRYHHNYETIGYPPFWNITKTTFHYAIDKRCNITNLKITKDKNSDHSILIVHIENTSDFEEKINTNTEVVTTKPTINKKYKFKNLKNCIESCKDLNLAADGTYGNCML